MGLHRDDESGEHACDGAAVIQFEDGQIYQADCFDILPTIGKVDLVLADMPYGTTQAAWDTPMELPLLWKAINHVRSPSTPIVLTAQTPFDKVLGASNVAELKYEWIWEKTEATGHLNSKKCPMKAHENILVFYSKQPKYYPIKTHGHARKTASRDRSRPDSVLYGVQSKFTSYDSTERYPRSVIKMSTDKQKSKLHPTQKPLALMEYLIRTYTEVGDTVLDFCMGSGTTCLAARNLGRKFIGIELDPSIFDIAYRRLIR